VSEPISFSSTAERETAKIYVPPRVRCKRGHEVEYYESLTPTITGRTHIDVGPLCPMCVAVYLREHFGMDYVTADKVGRDGR
jgi:hypothetical protein